MKLTKEKCLEAYKELDNALLEIDYVDGRAVAVYPVYEDELGIFRKLIDEYFELVKKYDELKRMSYMKQNINISDIGFYEEINLK